MTSQTTPTISRQQFIDLTGEDPVDVLGQDWKNDAEAWMEQEKCADCGQFPAKGACFYCKAD